MSVKTVQTAITQCDNCREEVMFNYISVPHMVIKIVEDDFEVVSMEIVDMHFCDKKCLMEFIGGVV